MSATRTEHDSLGELQVPADALYGAQTQRAVENFPVSGLKPHRAFVWSVAVIKQAAARVNGALGLLTPAVADAVERAGAEVAADQWADQFVVDPFQAGAGTSHHMNVNEVIAGRANQLLGVALDAAARPVHPNDHVNLGQSTNDVIPTAIRLGCLWRLDELTGEVRRLAGAWRERATTVDDVVKSGRTHLQDAVPVRLSQEFGAYARALERDAERLERAAEGLRRLGIGGTAAGTGLNAHPEYAARMVRELSALTGLDLNEADDRFEAMQSMADAVDFSAALRTLAVTLDRIANDVRLLSSGPATGLAEIRLPAVQPGSSIMPGKVNPVLAEMLNMVCFQVMGNDLTVMAAGQAGQLELNVMMPLIAHNLFGSMEILIGGMRAFTDRCVVGITADRARAAGWLARNTVLVTALNPVIGYERGAEVAKAAAASGRTLQEVVVERGYLTAEEAARLLDAARLTEGGIQA